MRVVISRFQYGCFFGVSQRPVTKRLNQPISRADGSVKVYVIGSGGFLGSHLSTWFGRIGVVKNALSFAESDVDTWQRRVLDEMLRFGPDVVLITGASQEMGDDTKSIHSLIASNCVFPCLIAEQLLKHLPRTSLVVFGSSWQFADSEDYRPFNLYAASKQAGQDLLLHYALRGLRILELITFDTYGEGDTRQKLLNILVDSCMRGEVVGTTLGEQEIDLVHIDDICMGVEAALNDLKKWDPAHGILVLGLGSGSPILVKELISRVGRQTGKEMRAKLGERPYRPREIMKVYKNYRRPSGWTPERTEFQIRADPVSCDRDLNVEFPE
jgi:CDP-3, 6-dideoxy-D-glycero-L-glycero-4-hexulose-4-reductase